MIEFKKFENFLPPDLLERVIAQVNDAGYSYGWKSSPRYRQSHWNRDFSGGGTANCLDRSEQLTGAIKDAWEYIQKTYFPDTEMSLMRCYTNAHTYGVEGYPHTDSKRTADQTVVLYLNHYWRREWGGETVLYDGQDIAHAEIPYYNRALMFPGIAWHAAKGVSRICTDLRMTLMFKVAPKDADPLRDDLQKFLKAVGAREKAHSGRSLMNHLLCTYDYLKLAGQSQTVCLAGGLHSIFGTNYYTDVTVKPEDREQVVNFAGEDAVKLIELFSTQNRPRVLEDYLTGAIPADIDKDTMDALCAIEGANLMDQSGLDTWPKLKEFWYNIYKYDC